MRSKLFRVVLLLCVAFFCVSVAHAESRVPAAAKNAFAAGDYSKAIEILNREAAESPGDAEVQHLLARCYFENEECARGGGGFAGAKKFRIPRTAGAHLWRKSGPLRLVERAIAGKKSTQGI